MIRIGPAGSGGLGHLKGLKAAAGSGLGCMEVEFTYGVRMDEAMAEKAGELAAELGIRLSVHAPYYINLASKEAEKVEASRERILSSCQRAHLLGAGPVVFHAGFYQGRSEDFVYQIVKQEITDLREVIEKAGWQIQLCPETTGKPSQFGSLEEVLQLMEDTGCGITVDFAHLYARAMGKIDYPGILTRLPDRFHAHFSGIEYTGKGEKKHVITTEAFFEPLARALIQAGVHTSLICESPDPMGDAVMMQRVISRLSNRKPLSA